jgi:polyferredoxin
MIVLILILLFALAGCVPGDGSYNRDKPAGFFWGVWHGWVAPISLILSLFNDHIRIYETANTGWWYDFGFYISIISGFGGLSLFRKKNKKD